MALQTLLPQYYDVINSNTANLINSSGGFNNNHMYVNDLTNNTYIQTSGNSQILSFGMGDIILRPQAINVNITMSGSVPFYVRKNIGSITNAAALFNNGGDIIARGSGDFYFPASGRFDTYSYPLFMCYSGYDLVELENSILSLNILPSAGVSLQSRISKIEMVVSGQPLYGSTCYMFIPGNVKNRILEHYPDEASPAGRTNSNTSYWAVRANYNDSNFNLGHYYLDEGSGNTIYSSGVSGSGVFKTINNQVVPNNSKAWYNYYNGTPFTYSTFYNHLVDINNSGVDRSTTYLDFGNITPTGDFSLLMRFLPSGETSVYSGVGTGYKTRSLFSAGDIRVETINNSDNIDFRVGNAYLPVDCFRFYNSNEIQTFLLTYSNSTASVYLERYGQFLGLGSTTGTRTGLSGIACVGAYTYPWYSGGYVPFDINYNSFGLAEFGLANYAFSYNDIVSFNKTITDFQEYIDESIHPSADNTYLEYKIFDGSGAFYNTIAVSPSSLPNNFYNLNTPFQFNEDLVAPSAIFLKVGITSNTTNPSGLIINGYIDNYTIYEAERLLTFYDLNIPSGYFQDFIILSGYYNKYSQSGFYYNDPYKYMKKADLNDTIAASIIINHPYSQRFSSNTKIHSVQFNYDGWFIPETGSNAITLYVSGDPIRAGDIDLFVEGSEDNDDIDLFIRGLLPYSGDTTLFTMGDIERGNLDLVMHSHISYSGDMTLFIRGQIESDNMPMYMHNEYYTDSGNVPMSIWGYSGSGLFGAIPFYMTANVNDNMNLYLHNDEIDNNTANMNMFVKGRTNMGGVDNCTLYIANSADIKTKNTTMYLEGARFIDSSANMPLFINRQTSNDSSFIPFIVANSGFGEDMTLFTEGGYYSNGNVTFFMPSSVTPSTGNTRLYTHGF